MLLENLSSNVTPIICQMQLNKKVTETARNEVHMCTKYESGVLIPENVVSSTLVHNGDDPKLLSGKL